MMRVYEYSDADSLRPRSHPWIDAESDPAYRYYDFRTQPELIRSSLEDLQQWHAYPAIETFYRLLEWLNGSDSIFESNDSAFNGAAATAGTPAAEPLQCSGRLMILYRDLAVNTSREQMHWLADAAATALSETDPMFDGGAIAVTIVPTQFITLPGPPERQRGQQLMLSFWAWGDTETEIMSHLDRIFQNLTGTLQRTSDVIRRSAPAASQP